MMKVKGISELGTGSVVRIFIHLSVFLGDIFFWIVAHEGRVSHLATRKQAMFFRSAGLLLKQRKHVQNAGVEHEWLKTLQ